MDATRHPWVRGHVSVPRAVLDELEREAEAAYARDEEACGFLVGDASAPLACDAAVILPNLANKYHALDPETYPRTARMFFLIDPRKFQRALEEGETNGRPVKVLWHSHLDVGAYFSETDAAAANMGGDGPANDLAYVVTSVLAGKVAEHRLFVWDETGRAYVESPLVVTLPMHRRVAAVVAFFAFAAPPLARADLTSDADRLVAAWRAGGSEADRRAPAFLEQGKTRLLPLDPADVAIAVDECTTIAVLASRGIDFTLHLGPADRRGQRALGGVAIVARCGPAREELTRMSVAMRAPRGALEVVVARGPAVAPPPTDTLVERFVPPPRPPIDPGRPPSTEPVAARVVRVGERARGDGAVGIATTESAAGDDGTAAVPLRLAPGCHRVEIVGESGARGRVADLDAELRDVTTGALLARDRSDTPDARVDACVGEETRALLSISGSPAGARLGVVDARWSLPPGAPESLGPRVRATIAAGHRRRLVPTVDAPPLAQSLGASGLTLVPFEVEPTSCYVATVAAVRGEPRALVVSGDVEGRVLRDDGGPARDGGTVAFCSGARDRHVLRVDARGTSLVWVLSLWKL